MPPHDMLVRATWTGGLIMDLGYWVWAFFWCAVVTGLVAVMFMEPPE